MLGIDRPLAVLWKTMSQVSTSSSHSGWWTKSRCTLTWWRCVCCSIISDSFWMIFECLIALNSQVLNEMFHDHARIVGFLWIHKLISLVDCFPNVLLKKCSRSPFEYHQFNIPKWKILTFHEHDSQSLCLHSKRKTYKINTNSTTANRTLENNNTN